MQPFLSALIPAQMDPLTAVKGSDVSSRGDFPSAIRKARARLGLTGLDNASSAIQMQGSPTAEAREKAGKRKSPDGTFVAVREFEPLTVLLKACGVPPERTSAFLDSLNVDYPDGKVPLGDLMARVRTLIFSEKGGNGQVLLEPKSRLALESGLTQWGLSPKEAERILALSSTGNGQIEVERFLELSVLHRKTAAENLNGAAMGESKLGKSSPVEQAGSAGTLSQAEIAKTRSRGSETLRGTEAKASMADAGGDPTRVLSADREGTGREGTILSFKAENRKWTPAVGTAGRGDGRTGNTGEPLSLKAMESPSAKQAPDHMTVRSEKPQKSGSLSLNGRLEGEERGMIGPDRSRGTIGAEGPRRGTKDLAANDAGNSLEVRSLAVNGPGSPQHTAKPSGAQTQPLPLHENPIPAHVAAQVSRQISRAVLSGDQTIRMHLNPPELGVLKVQLSWSQDALKIEMVTDRYPSKDLLLASVSELKEALGEQGFRVEKMEVLVNDPSGQSLTHSGREHKNPSSPGMGPQEENKSFPNDKKGEGRPERALPSLEGRLLDLVA